MPQINADVDFVMTETFGDHPLITDILYDHVKEVSKDPANEFVVSRDYLDPEDEGQVELHEGEIVEVMQRTLCGWWFVSKQDGSEGWASAGYLEPLDPYDTSDIQQENREL